MGNVSAGGPQVLVDHLLWGSRPLPLGRELAPHRRLQLRVHAQLPRAQGRVGGLVRDPGPRHAARHGVGAATIYGPGAAHHRLLRCLHPDWAGVWPLPAGIAGRQASGGGRRRRRRRGGGRSRRAPRRAQLGRAPPGRVLKQGLTGTQPGGRICYTAPVRLV